MKVFILAGGLGTRLKPLTDNQPKVMIKVGNKPILEHLVNLCVKHNFSDIIISLHHLPKPVTQYFDNGVTNINLTKMVQFHQQKKGLATFLVHQTDHPYDSDLVEFDENHLITKFFRPQKGDKFKPISKTGTHIFEPEVLEIIPKDINYSLEKQLIPDLLKQGKKLYAYYSNEYSKDMGTPQRLAQVKKDYEANKISI